MLIHPRDYFLSIEEAEILLTLDAEEIAAVVPGRFTFFRGGASCRIAPNIIDSIAPEHGMAYDKFLSGSEAFVVAMLNVEGLLGGVNRFEVGEIAFDHIFEYEMELPINNSFSLNGEIIEPEKIGPCSISLRKGCTMDTAVYLSLREISNVNESKGFVRSNLSEMVRRDSHPNFGYSAVCNSFFDGDPIIESLFGVVHYFTEKAKSPEELTDIEKDNSSNAEFSRVDLESAKMLQSKERDSLLITIAAMALLLSRKKPGLYKRGEKLNRSGITRELHHQLSEYGIDVEGLGIGAENLRQRINSGLEILKNLGIQIEDP